MGFQAKAYQGYKQTAEKLQINIPTKKEKYKDL